MLSLHFTYRRIINMILITITKVVLRACVFNADRIRFLGFLTETVSVFRLTGTEIHIPLRTVLSSVTSASVPPSRTITMDAIFSREGEKGRSCFSPAIRLFEHESMLEIHRGFQITYIFGPSSARLHRSICGDLHKTRYPRSPEIPE